MTCRSSMRFTLDALGLQRTSRMIFDDLSSSSSIREKKNPLVRKHLHLTITQSHIHAPHRTSCFDFLLSPPSGQTSVYCLCSPEDEPWFSLMFRDIPASSRALSRPLMNSKASRGCQWCFGHSLGTGFKRFQVYFSPLVLQL